MIKDYDTYLSSITDTTTTLSPAELESELGRDYLTMTYVEGTAFVPPTFDFGGVSGEDYYTEEKLKLESRVESSFNILKSSCVDLDYLNTSKHVLYHPGDIITYKAKPCVIKSVTSVGMITWYGDSMVILPTQVVLLNNMKKIRPKHIPVLYSEIRKSIMDVPITVYFSTFCDYFDMQESVIYQYISKSDKEELIQELSLHVDVSKIKEQLF